MIKECGCYDAYVPGTGEAYEEVLEEQEMKEVGVCSIHNIKQGKQYSMNIPIFFFIDLSMFISLFDLLMLYTNSHPKIFVSRVLFFNFQMIVATI